MQAKLQEAQAALATQTFNASVAGGAVVATVNGQGQMVNLHLEADFLKESASLVASTIVSAVTQAQQAATKASEETMNALTGPMRGMFG